MTSWRSIPLLLLASAALGACATPADYPSLSIRDTERVSGSISAPEGPISLPDPPSAATLGEIDSLVAQVRDAHRNFLTAADDARSPVNSARTAQMGSPEWSVAQVAIANLESMRSSAMIALADLDRLYIDTTVQGDEAGAIETARTDVTAIVTDQDRLIASLLATLRN